MLKKHFKVSSSKNIPTKSLEEAKRLVYNWRPSDCFILAKTDEMIEEYDKGILQKVSYNLQHSRNNVVISYLWKM